MDVATSKNFDELTTIKLKAERKSSQTKQTKRRTFPPGTDVCLWLTGNAPASAEELIDLRYCLYHRCSRANFIVSSRCEDEFQLAGLSSTVTVR